jgi:hypothetical protein
MMCAVVDVNTSDGASRNDEGVLTNLPRTRPQRSSPRRAAARANAAGAKRGPKPKKADVSGAKRSTKRTGAGAPARDAVTAVPVPTPSAKRRAAPPRPSIPIDDPAPRQGFECEPDASGSSVQPPGGAELVASAAELAGELAKAGLSTGERLVKDMISRLPLS